MTESLPSAGSASPELALQVRETWADEARRVGIDLSGFDPSAPTGPRLAWARAAGLEIGCALSRYSSKLQHSTGAQIHECLVFAAGRRIYVPPEFACVDEGVSGRKQRRDGLDRVKAILGRRLADTLVVFKLSRLFRKAAAGYMFLEELVEEGLRVVSVSEGIDTTDEETWRPLVQVHGMVDEFFVRKTADHVRAGHKEHFRQGYSIGGSTLGYRPRELPDARPTALGRPRTAPEVDPDLAPRIRKHFELHRDGMSLAEGRRLWLAEGRACDPASRAANLSAVAYRRMLSNPRYKGDWEYGRRKNVWSTKRDYVRTVERPESEILHRHDEALRIVDDELYEAVQARLASQKLGPRGPRGPKPKRLCDYVVDCFYCARCGDRFFAGAAQGNGMFCKRGTDCPCRVILRRDVAVAAVLEPLGAILRDDAGLVARVVELAQAADRDDGGSCPDEVARLERQLAALNRKIEVLTDAAGVDDDADLADLKAKLRATVAERSMLQARLGRLRRAPARDPGSIGPDRVRALLSDLASLLEDGASGRLGPDVACRAAEAFRRLVGGRIDVHVVPRAGRQHASVRGSFRPDLLRVAGEALELPDAADTAEPAPVEVWLRPPPRVDLLAERMHRLVDGEGLSITEAAGRLRQEGHRFDRTRSWAFYRRYYEMIGQPAPEHSYNNGRPRRRQPT